MKLTPRLQIIAQLVPKSTMVADIGTDHGYIPVFLVENQIAHKVIAADVNQGPLDRAQKNIEAHRMEDRIETRLGNGLDVLEPGEVDTVIIAGMGGLLIRDILASNPQITQSVNTFVLQPMVGQDELRKWLLNNEFTIIDEKIAKEEHRLYEILVVKKGKESVDDDIHYEIGKKLIENQDPLLNELIEKYLKKYHEILYHLKAQNSEAGNEKRKLCQQKVAKLEEVLKCLKNVEKL